MEDNLSGVFSAKTEPDITEGISFCDDEPWIGNFALGKNKFSFKS